MPQRSLKALSDEELVAAEADWRDADRVRRQPEQPRAADRARLRHPDAARPRPRSSRRPGFDSVWVGDCLFSKPRYEPISLPVGDLAAHVAGAARHRVHGLLDAQPALPRARVGDARRDLGRPDDPRHRDGQPRGGRAPRVRGARARLRPTRRALRGGARRHPRSSGPRAETDFHGRVPRLRRRLVLLGHRDGPADADPDAAADLGRFRTRASRATRRRT